MSSRARLRVAASSLLAVCLLSLPSGAVQPTEATRRDAARFRVAARATAPKGPSLQVSAAAASFRGRHPAATVQFSDRTGRVSILSGFSSQARKGDPETAARTFLAEQSGLLGLRDEELRLLVRRSNNGEHLLFEQVRGGIPVEGARVGVHLDAGGAVHHLTSSFEPEFPALKPRVSEGTARAAAAADLGAPIGARGTMVWFPDPSNGALRLAWKFRESSRGPRGLWVSYVDAEDGRLLFRYDDLRYAGCLSSGTVRGEVFPSSPIGVDPSTVPLANLYVQVADVSLSSTVLTNTNGEYCSGFPGRIFTSLRGLYAVVANDDFPNAAYDNGAGKWFEIATPVSSPNPYPASSNQTTVLSGPVNALKLRAHFSAFDVGVNNDVSYDNDRVDLRDSQDRLLASYIGQNKLPFDSNEVVGRTMKLQLISNADRQGAGWTVDKSSYFVLTVTTPIAMTDPARTGFDVVFSSSTSYDKRAIYSYADETNVYHHMNKMRDFFVALNPGNPIAVSSPMVAVTHAGVNFLNAFYDPELGHLYFGDGLQNLCSKITGLQPFFDCSFALDSTVVRHEYTHLAMDKIYPLINFGQAGAISEGISDYMALTSLGLSKMGQFANAGDTAFRDLNDGIDDLPSSRCAVGKCQKFPENWEGEIHQDSLQLSQALWSIRQTLPGGAATVDSMVMSSLFYFPQSFMEFRAAMLAVADNVTQDPTINTIFAEHGISTTTFAAGDSHEPNDGPGTATDASSILTLDGTIRPRGDNDFFAFPAGPGTVRAVLDLPLNDPNVPAEFIALGMGLNGPRNEFLTSQDPVISNGTGAGGCPDPVTGGGNCLTGDKQVVLTYENASSRVLYLSVTCGFTDFSSPALCDSARPYRLTLTYNPAGAVTGSVMTASFDDDEFKFSIPMVSYAGGSVYSFSHAILRDHNGKALAETDSRSGSLPLAISSTATVSGVLSGRLRLAGGFAARYPAVGAVHLEVFGNSRFGSPASLGVSAPLGLTQKAAEFKAWNNVMNPMKGDRTTLKFALTGGGRVILRIFTMRGELVRTLYDGPASSGGSADWDGRNDQGAFVASGIYLAHVEGPGLNKTQKIVLVK